MGHCQATYLRLPAAALKRKSQLSLINPRRVLSALVWLIPWRIRARIKSLPLVSELQRRITSAVLDGREFEHTVDAGPAKGIRFLVSMPADKGIWTGGYEAEFAIPLAAEMARHHGAVAFDIGGWHGFFAGVMAANGAGAVHVFEPLPDNQYRIQKLIELNPERRIVLHATALGEQDGECDLLVMPDTSMAKLSDSSFQPNVPAMRRLAVPIARLDTMLSANLVPPPHLLKIDVEGAEAAVLYGATTLIRTHRPVVFLEIHSADLLRACTEVFASHDYIVTPLDVDLATAEERGLFHVVARPKSR